MISPRAGCSVGLEFMLPSERARGLFMKHTKPKPPDLSKAWLHSLWYEDVKGHKRPVTEKEMRSMTTPSVKRWPYALVCFPNEIRTTIYERRKDGGYGTKDSMGTFGSTANSEDLVLALVRKEGLRLYDAIRTVSQACERCLNVLGNRYHLGWGYRIDSKQSKSANTKCNLCS